MIKITIRTSDLGGTNWTAEMAKSADLNDTFGAVTIHRKQFSDATERTTTSGSFVDSGTEFTFSVPINSLILSMYLTLEVKDDSASTAAEVSFQISGSNFGTKYLITRLLHQGEGQSYMLADLTTGETNIFTTGDATISYVNRAIASSLPIKILDATTTFKIRFKLSNPITTAYIKNVTLDIVYAEAYKED